MRNGLDVFVRTVEQSDGSFAVQTSYGDGRLAINAELSVDGKKDAPPDWFYVSTDSCEGTAMINIEALPAVISALTRMKNDLRKSGRLPKAKRWQS